MPAFAAFIRSGAASATAFADGVTQYFGRASGGNGTLSSTEHATKGKLYFGSAQTSAFDEANGRLGIGTGSPTEALDIFGKLTIDASGSLRTLPAADGSFYTNIHTPNDTHTKTFRTSFGEFDNPGGNPRKDCAWGWGYNYDVGSINYDPTEHSFGLKIESAFGPAGSEQVECYFEGKSTDGTNLRPLGFTFNCITGATAANIVSNSFEFQSAAGATSAVTLQTTGALTFKVGTGGGGSGAILFQMFNTAGQSFLTADTSLGMRWYTNGCGNVPGILFDADAAQTSYLFRARVNSAITFEVAANGNVALGGASSYGASMVGGIAHKNGTAPSGNVTDCYQQYAADQAAGNSAPHWRTENGDVIQLYKTGTLTQTYSTADATLSAYTSDPESSVYTGAADSEAKLADLNALRVAYENLRTFTEDLAAFVNSTVDDLQLLGVVG